MRGRYIVGLAILGVYFIASYLVLHQAIANQRSMGRAVVASGQQRMYSQRIAMFADAMVARPDRLQRDQARHDLEASIRIFTQAHQALTTGDPHLNPAGWPPSSVRSMYFDLPFAVDQQVKEYVGHALAVQTRAGLRAGNADLEYLLSVGPGPLLQSLDA